MRNRLISTLVPAAALAFAASGCTSPSGPPADRIVYRTEEAPSPALDSWPASQATPAPGPTPATTHGPRPPGEMSEGERRAWFQSQGIYPYPWYPTSEGQNLGYVHQPTDYSWVAPVLLTAGALYGLYRLKRHYDWW